jgi:hypothetical protein
MKKDLHTHGEMHGCSSKRLEAQNHNKKTIPGAIDNAWRN